VQSQRKYDIVEERVGYTVADPLQLADERLACWTAASNQDDFFEKGPNLERTAVGEGFKHRGRIAGTRHDRNPVAHSLEERLLVSSLEAAASELKRGSDQVVHDKKRDQAEDWEPEPRPGDRRSGDRESNPGQNPCRHGYRRETCLGKRDADRFRPYKPSNATTHPSGSSTQIIGRHGSQTGEGDRQAGND